jgi:integrase
MARRPRASAIENRTARLKLPVRKKPYAFTTIAAGVALGYRRNQGAGTWVVRVADGAGGNWTKGFAVADDHEGADAEHGILDFWMAQDRARALARGKDQDSGRPGTVAEALDDYGRHIARHDGGPGNVSRLRHHLPPALASKPVAMLTERDLESWRDKLVGAGLAPATVVRTAKVFKAALNLAARRDKRITNVSAWRDGLGKMVDSYNARNAGLPDAAVHALIAAGYAVDGALGVFVETAAVTGARPVQLARLQVADLQDRWREGPRLQMPSSKKGKGVRRVERKPVPITPALAAKLRQAAGSRPPQAALLLKSNGGTWGRADHSQRVASAVAKAGLDPKTTIYSLRHTSIIRQLLRGVPTRVVAAHHDTSTAIIERTYSACISDHADALTRGTLLDTSQPAAGNVVPLSGRRP